MYQYNPPKVPLHPALSVEDGKITTSEGLVYHLDDVCMFPGSVTHTRQSIHFGMLLCEADWAYVPILSMTHAEYLILCARHHKETGELISDQGHLDFISYMHAQVRMVETKIEQTHPHIIDPRY